MKSLLILAILGALLTIGFSHPPHHKGGPFNGNPLSHKPRPSDFADFGEDAELESDFSDNFESERPAAVNDNDEETGEFLPPPPPHRGGRHGERPPFGKHHGKHPRFPRFRGSREEEEGLNIAKNKEALREVNIEDESFEHPRPFHHPHKFNRPEGFHHGFGKRHERRGPGGRRGHGGRRHNKGNKGPNHKRFPRKHEETKSDSFDEIVRNEKLIKVDPVEKL